MAVPPLKPKATLSAAAVVPAVPSVAAPAPAPAPTPAPVPIITPPPKPTPITVEALYLELLHKQFPEAKLQPFVNACANVHAKLPDYIRLSDKIADATVPDQYAAVASICIPMMYVVEEYLKTSYHDYSLHSYIAAPIEAVDDNGNDQAEFYMIAAAAEVHAFEYAVVKAMQFAQQYTAFTQDGMHTGLLIRMIMRAAIRMEHMDAWLHVHPTVRHVTLEAASAEYLRHTFPDGTPKAMPDTWMEAALLAEYYATAESVGNKFVDDTSEVDEWDEAISQIATQKATQFDDDIPW